MTEALNEHNIQIGGKHFIFKPFNQQTFTATEKAWLSDAQAGEAFVPDVLQGMAWAKDHMTLVDNGVAYGVFIDKAHIAIGICELVVTKPDVRGKWVKLLRLRVRPEIEELLFNNDPSALATAVNAYVCAVIGVYHVKNVHKATTIKVYARTQEQMRFLTLLVTKLNEQEDATFKAAIQGRWLTLNWKKHD